MFQKKLELLKPIWNEREGEKTTGISFFNRIVNEKVSFNLVEVQENEPVFIAKYGSSNLLQSTKYFNTCQYHYR